MHIVLHEPEIPGNTGNIGRSCAATNTSLHLIEPLGFDITEKELRRAGLDYWSQLDVHRYRDYEDFLLEQFGSRSYRSGRSDCGSSMAKGSSSAVIRCIKVNDFKAFSLLFRVSAYRIIP